VTRRLLLGYLGLTLFVLLSLEIPLGIQNQRTERRDLTANVSHDATVLAADAEDAVQAASPSQARLAPLAGVAASYARRTGGRVVIANVDGYALIDTQQGAAGVESFASRPEIAAALRGSYASGVRPSSTAGGRLLYVAVPISSGGRVHGAVRITYPLSAVDARIRRYWLLLLAVAAVVLLAAALVGIRLARFVTRPLLGLETAAAAVGEGRLDVRAPERDGPPEVRSLAAAFNDTVVKVGQLLRSQREFVEDASHELRTPLTALRLRLEAAEHAAGGVAREDLDAAVAEVERLSQLVEGLLALARADAGAPTSEHVDAAAVVRERLDAWRPLGEERGVRLAAELDGEQPVRAGRTRLAQALDNLVANALEVAPAGSAVTVSAHGVPDAVELRVRDAGPGMTDAQKARAFDRFWRAGSGAGHSGLGLAIVRKLVELDEGEVELVDAPGGGLEAVIRLRRA
jgi:signal transduction histidine kinase